MMPSSGVVKKQKKQGPMEIACRAEGPQLSLTDNLCQQLMVRVPSGVATRIR